MTIKSAGDATGKIEGSHKPRSLVSVLGVELIQEIIAPFVDYLETAAAAFEQDGTRIGDILTGNSYCRLLAEAIERDADGVAARGFRDSYHKAVFAAVSSGQQQEIAGAGMTACASPIIAGGTVVGVLIGAVSEVPSDEKFIRRAAEVTDVDFNLLRDAAGETSRKSDHLFEAARRHLVRLAGTIGYLYENALAKEQAYAEAGKCELELIATRDIDERILNSMAEGAYTCDMERNFTYLNPASAKITGYEPQELIGKNISTLIPEDQLGKLQEMIARRNEGLVDRYELDLIRKDGVRITVNQTVSPFFLNGAVVGTVGVAVDVTQRRIMRARLEQQNQRLNLLQSVMEKSVSGLAQGKALKTLVHEVADTFGYDLCNIFMPVSDGTKLQIVASHGYDDDFVKSLNAGLTFSFEYQGAAGTPAMVAFRHGRQSVLGDVVKETPEPMLVQAARKHGFHSMAATPLEYRGERLGAMAVYTRDMHQFDEEELRLLSSIAAQASTIAGSALVYDQLAQSEERYRELYNKAADWMYTLDGDGVISVCNETMSQALQIPKEKIIGSHIYDFEADPDREKARAALAAFREKSEVGMTFTAERNFLTAGGERLVVEVHALTLPSETGESLQWRAVARDITEKKEAEARLNLLAAAVENTHECVMISDLDGNILSINNAGADLLGYETGAMVGMQMGELWSAENPEDLRERIFEQTMADGWEGQMWYRRADGSTFPVFVSSARVDDTRGAPIAIVGIARDVSTEQRMTTEILRRNRELAVLNAVATTAATSLDLNSTLQSSVNSVVDSMSYDAGVIYLLDAGGSELIPRASNGAPDDMLERVARIKVGEGYAGTIATTGEPMFAEDTADNPNRLQGLPDKPWFVSIGGVPLVSKDTLLGVMIVGTREHYDFDAAERLLLASVGKTIGVAIDNARLFDDVTRGRNEWESTFDTMTNGVSIHGRDFTILRANRALAKLLGTTAEELVGKKCYEVFHKSKTPLDDCPLAKAMIDRQSHSLIMEETTLGRILSISSDPIIDNDGQITGAVHDVQDITEQEHLRDQLTQSEKIRALGEMAGGVAHDFNNFLTVIMGNTQLLLSQLEASGSDGDFRESLESVQRAAADAAETVRRVQEFTRVRTVRSFTTVDVNGVIDHAIDVARPRWRDEADARGVKIEIMTNLADVPPVYANESELSEVFVNLLLNATDALSGGGSIKLTTDVEDSGEWITVSVADNGQGMDEDVRRRIFEPFFSTKGVSGSGLGLSVAYGIIKRHGGDIMVTSDRGEGTCFTVRLPAATAADLTMTCGTVETPEPVRPAKLLVIDDAPMIRTLLGDMLEKMGQSFETAGGGPEGLKLFDQAAVDGEPFDLVLTDLGMPEMSGWEVVEAVKQRRPETPVALITGWGDQLEPEKMKESAVDMVIAKPFRVEDIRRLLAKALT